MNDALEMLEYTTILNQIAELTHTEAARRRALELRPTKDLVLIYQRAHWIGQAARCLEVSAPPLTAITDVEAALPLLKLNEILSTDQLTKLGMFLTACRRMQLYLGRMKETASQIAAWQFSIDALPELADEVERCIRGDEVDDRASPELRSVRRQAEIVEDRMRAKLESLLRAHPGWFADQFVTQRGGRLVLPLKKEHRREVAGSVADLSSSGSTVFIEPSSVGSMREELEMLRIRERNEIQRILAELSARFAEKAAELKQNKECLEELDFYFACAALAKQQRAVEPRVEDLRQIRLVGARHPLLPVKSCVPLDFFLGTQPAEVGVVITGPNTGGKTVALKTVGLLCLMAQTGLHVPCKEGLFPVLDQVLCDLGDGQSIEQNLSTFSSHVRRWVDILQKTTTDTLVLCDELGNGTDPQEGMGLAVAMLEGLANRGALILATTHYPEIKTFAETTPGFLNASMTFDPVTLSPLYRMELGRAGQSCALLIARRLGLPEDVLVRAAEVCGSKMLKAAPINAAEKTVKMPSAPPKEEVEPQPVKKPSPGSRFQVGDSVYVHPLHRTGIVAQGANAKGEVVVKVADRKYTVNHRRLSPHLSKEELYPDAENYDLDIVLDSVANRKMKKKMSKHHVEGGVVTLTDEPDAHL